MRSLFGSRFGGGCSVAGMRNSVPVRAFGTTQRPPLVPPFQPSNQLLPLPVCSMRPCSISLLYGGRRGISSSSPPSRLATLIREYGPIGLGVYTCITFTVFCTILTTIHVIGEDAVLGWVGSVKAAIGLASPDSTSDQANVTQDSWISRHPFMAKALLAIGLSKLLLPFKLAATASLAPMVARRLRIWGFDLGAKGGLKTSIQDAQSRIRTKIDKRDKGH